MSLCLVAIFKNESHILHEFVTHYVKQGVVRFYFIDNGSTDTWKESLQPFKDIVHVLTDSSKHAQTRLYNTYLNVCKLHEWVIVVDLDEFIYARNGFSTIQEYLHSLQETITSVCVPWKMFGSNGHIEQPTQVIPSFTKRSNYDKKEGFQGVIQENGVNYSLHKSILRTRYVTHFGIHSSETTGTSITSDNCTTSSFSAIDESILQKSCLHLNHYCIQSYDWFMKVKSTRGAADSSTHENLRNETYFKSYDAVSNDKEDIELSIKLNIVVELL